MVSLQAWSYQPRACRMYTSLKVFHLRKMTFRFIFATCVEKATKLALHLTGIFVMSVGEPASNWNAQFVAGSSRDPITCVSMPVSICQNILAIRLVVWVAVAAVEEEISRPWTIFELWRVKSSDFNAAYFCPRMKRVISFRADYSVLAEFIWKPSFNCH